MLIQENTQRLNSQHLIAGLKEFGLNPEEWDIYELERKGDGNKKSCLLIRSKEDSDFQILGWTKKTKSCIQWDRLKIFSL